MKDSIDTAKVASALCAATSSVFADMAFLDASCLPDEDRYRPQEVFDICTVIDILKPLSWRLELRMPKTLSDSIMETLGSEGPDTDDAVLEMVNILAGVFISEYFGPGAAIKLELPTYMYEAIDDEEEPIVRVLGNAEGTPFEVLIRSVRYRY